jgi:hypothetical protein
MSVADIFKLRCPQCGNDDKLGVQMLCSIALVSDGGLEPMPGSDWEYDGNSPTQCHCGRGGC